MNIAEACLLSFMSVSLDGHVRWRTACISALMSVHKRVHAQGAALHTYKFRHSLKCISIERLILKSVY